MAFLALIASPILDFAVTYKVPLLFYLGVIIIIFAFRKHITWQAKFIGLYKTKFGVATMNRWSKKYRELFRWLGYVGVGVGFFGMAVIIFMLLQGLWNLIFVPGAPAVIAPVIPGFNIPGVGITVPLVTGWIALFVVILIHEFSHGLVSKSHDIKVKSSGLLVFGPLLGAFVEPEEKKLQKADDIVQYSVYAAGPFSNILATIFFAVILSLIISPIILAMTMPVGVSLDSVTADSPAAIGGLEEGMLIINADGVVVQDIEDFQGALETLRAGEKTVITTSDAVRHEITAGVNPKRDTAKGYLGINMRNERNPVRGDGWYLFLLNIITWIKELVTWVVILNLGIGLANLLPLGPVDGGRMTQVLFTRLWGKETGNFRWKRLSILVLIIILVLLFIPIIKAMFW